MYGDPVLREKSAPFAAVNDDARKLAADMIETMRANEGIGLAAQQVGLAKAICVIDMPETYDRDGDGPRFNPEVKMPLVLINPELSDPSRDTTGHEEGCLSFPEIRGNITRPDEITVKYLDETGAARAFRARRFLARVIQHEVDHLNGVLFIDRMSMPKRLALKSRLERLRRKTKAALGLD